MAGDSRLGWRDRIASFSLSNAAFARVSEIQAIGLVPCSARSKKLKSLFDRRGGRLNVLVISDCLRFLIAYWALTEHVLVQIFTLL